MNFKFGNSKKTNMVENVVQDMMTMIFSLHVGMITELNIASVTITNQDWWLDFGVMIHVCNDKSYLRHIQK